MEEEKAENLKEISSSTELSALAIDNQPGVSNAPNITAQKPKETPKQSQITLSSDPACPSPLISNSLETNSFVANNLEDHTLEIYNIEDHTLEIYNLDDHTLEIYNLENNNARIYNLDENAEIYNIEEENEDIYNLVDENGEIYNFEGDNGEIYNIEDCNAESYSLVDNNETIRNLKENNLESSNVDNNLESNNMEAKNALAKNLGTNNVAPKNLESNTLQSNLQPSILQANILNAGNIQANNVPTNTLQANKFNNLSKSEHAITTTILDADFAKALIISSISFQQKTPNFRDDPRFKDDSTASQSCVDDARRNIISNIGEKIEKDEKVKLTEITRTLASMKTQEINVKNEANAIFNALAFEMRPTKIRMDEKPAGVHKPVISEKKSIHKTVAMEPKRADSLSSFGSNVCRICMTRGRERLVSPCHCKGSMASVHLTCLERWLNQVGRNQCELCGFLYPAIRTPRYTVVQALRLWFGNPRNRSHLQSDCMIFWLLSSVTAALMAICIYGTQYFVVEGNKFSKLDVGVSRRLTETAMDLFMALVLFGYSVTAYLLWKDHFSMWNRWRRANVNVRLLLSPDASPVPFTPRPRSRV